MNCKKCIYFPCTKKQCGEDKECKDYRNIISEAIKIIDKCKREEN